VSLYGHQDWVMSIVVLADGRIISASADHTIRVWSAAGDICIQRLPAHTDAVHALALVSLAPQHGMEAETLVVSASHDKTLRIWHADETPRGELTFVAALVGHEGWVLAVAPCGTDRIASGSSDCTIRVWSNEGSNEGRFKTTAVCQGHTGWVLSVKKLDQERIVSGSEDRTVRLWNVFGVPLTIYQGHTSAVYCLTILSGERVVSGSADSTMRIWSTDPEHLPFFEAYPEYTGCLVAIPAHNKFVQCVETLQDNTWISASADMSIRTWQMDSESTRAVSNLDYISVVHVADPQGPNGVDYRMPGQCHLKHVSAIAILGDERCILCKNKTMAVKMVKSF